VSVHVLQQCATGEFARTIGVYTYIHRYIDKCYIPIYVFGLLWV